MRISAELVPRNEASLKKELSLIREKFATVDTINIPDLMRYEVRSWDAAAVSKHFFPKVIPHIRAMDFALDAPFPFQDTFLKNNIDEVLVIAGDLPEGVDSPPYPTTTIDTIKKLKKELPRVKVYAGIDQYRQSFEKECEYIDEKRAAGADGFMTQPFFEIPFMQKYQAHLAHTTVFWGLTPIERKSTMRYWMTKNKVVFPENFKPTLVWSKAFAKEALEFIEANGSHVYLMPILTDVVEYLSAVVS